MATEKLVHLGTDIDDSIVHSGELTIATINETYGPTHGTNLVLGDWYREPFDTVLWGIDQVTSWGWVNAVLHSDEFIRDVEIVKGAERVLRFLKDEEQEASASTGRPDTIPNRIGTLALLEHKFPGVFDSDHLHFSDHFAQLKTGGSKVAIAIAMGFTHVVDDHLVKQANPLAAAGFKTYLLDRVWNQDGELHPNVQRVVDFDEIGEYLETEMEQLASMDPADRPRLRELI